MKRARNALWLIMWVLVIILLIVAFRYFRGVYYGCERIDSNCVLAVATVLLIVVGSLQLEKLNAYNNMHALFESEREWKSDEFKKQRIETVSLLAPFLVSTNKLDDLGEKEWNRIMTTAEEVFDYFDIVSYYQLKGLYTIDDIYECYGYFLKYYWLLCRETNYISNVRRRTGKEDMYVPFKAMFDKIFLLNASYIIWI